MIPLARIVERLRQPDFYPHGPATVSLEQTHISYVFLAGDFVYKIKKPVRFTFLDFSTLEARHHLCHEEVRLNRRLAPDVYLGVLSLCAAGDSLFWGEADDPRAIEYVVHMRRLPHERLLDHRLDAGDVSVATVEPIADALAAFHAAAATSPEITANGSAAGVRAILQDNYDNGRRFHGVTVDAADDEAIQAYSRTFLERHADLFARRQALGKIRECHGDLHCEHVCLTEPLVIFDCIEFNTQFRYIDVISDVAFLAMDLDYHDRPDLSAALLRRYREATGDDDVPTLSPFYQCYRAYVRGKVDSLKGVEADVPEAERQQALASARRHFELAYRYTWAASPALIVVCGLSGSGKSSVARRLARRTGFVHVSSDVLRKEMLGLAPTQRPRRDAYEAGIYAPEISERTYAALFETARSTLSSGRGVILDATFQLARGRDQARAIAASAQAPVVFVECVCAPEEIRRRLALRQQRDDDPSDADWNVYLRQREAFEPFAEGDADAIRLDTTTTTEDVSRIETLLRHRTG